MLPRTPRTVRVVHVNDTALTLEATRETTHPGTFEAWFGRTGHAIIGRILSQDRTANTVTREIRQVTGGELKTKRCYTRRPSSSH